MLKHHMLQEQTFGNEIEEVKKQSMEVAEQWIEFQPQDPAKKILEDLTTFSILQQNYIESMPETVQEKIFHMAGFQRENGKSARVLIESENVEKAVQIPAGQRFRVGDLCFETNKDFTVRGNRLVGIYTKWQDTITDFSYILDENYPMAGEVFTRQPQRGMEIYFVLDEMLKVGEDLIFYVQIAKEYGRNESEGKNIFAHIKWQIYTKRGFIDIRCKDGTESFVNSGELSFRMPKDEVVMYDELPKKGYLIRGILNRAEYDIVPKIKSIKSFLFEVWQKETKSVCYTYSGKKQTIELYCHILENGCMQVFCKENQEDDYYLYKQKDEAESGERVYNLERLGYGKYQISFENDNYQPGKFENAIKIVLYDEEMMKNFEVGCIYGYDNQRMALPAKQIVKESFSVIVEKKNINGEKKYYFIRPDSTKKGELRYSLNEKDGYLVIENAEDFIGSNIYLGGCTITGGASGNIREGCILNPVGETFQVTFTNPVRGKGGCDFEEIAQVRQRVIQDLKTHYTAVEARDYEELIKSTPALCIDKVKAVRDEKNNRIKVIVKPLSNQPFPTLSETYQIAIKKQIEKARLLSVMVEVCQPVYVPVEIYGSIYVKTNSEGCRKQIEAVIKQELDYTAKGHNFGERFCFDGLLEKIENLDCVKYVYDLSVSLTEQLHAVQKGFDIQPAENCLLYPGKIELELKALD